MNTVASVGSRSEPVCVALVDDYDVVVVGLAHLLDPYPDRVVVAELDTNQPVLDEVDVVLYDTFAQPEADHGDIDVLVNSADAHHVAVYTWNFHPTSSIALARGRTATSPRPFRHGSRRRHRVDRPRADRHR